MKKWQFQEAKAKLSAVIKEAISVGPQQITVRGKTTVIVLSAEQYRDLTSPQSSFVEFLQKSPLHGLSISTERDKSLCRDVEL